LPDFRAKAEALAYLEAQTRSLNGYTVGETDPESEKGPAVGRASLLLLFLL
jgi:hypothetical protein